MSMMSFKKIKSAPRRRGTLLPCALAGAGLLLACGAELSANSETEPPARDGADWPQFLGPNRDGMAPDRTIRRDWPESGPPELWSVPLGGGFGGASMKDGEVYVLDRPDTDRDVLRCFDLATGAKKWEFAYETRQVQLPYPGSRSTPTIHGDFLFIVGPVGDLHCVDRRDGRPVWRRNLLDEFNLQQTANWGYSQSPLVHGDLVIVAPMNDETGYVAAYDLLTGEPRWQAEGMGGGSYVTPRLYNLDGVPQVLTYGRLLHPGQPQGQWTSLDPVSGRILWQYRGYYNRILIPFPTDIGDGRLFVTGGYGAGSVMIRVERQDDTFSVSEEWRLPDEGSQVHAALLHEGHLYANFNTNENLRGRQHEGGLACISLDGEILWRTGEEPNFERGNLLLVGGLILIMDGELGELALVEPRPDGYKELARATVFTDLRRRGNLIWAPMALADGRLIVRSQNELKCLDLRPNRGGGARAALAE